MDEKIFKASFKRNIMVGVNVGIPISLILMVVTLAADLGEACAFIAAALGILIGILWRTIIKPKEIAGINDDSVWFGTKRSKKHEFKLDESGFRLSTDIQRFLGVIPIVTRSLIVDTKGKRKVISCSFLSKSDFGHFSSLLNQRISKPFERKTNNQTSYDKAATEFKEYSIPKKQILKVMSKRSKIGIITLSITFGVIFLWVLISSIIQGNLDDYYIIIFSGFLADVLIAGITLLCINTKWKKIGKSIPHEVSISGDCIYITNYNNDTKSYPYSEIQKLTMTPIKGGTDGFRRIIINCPDTQDTYCFGLVAGANKVFPQYPEMFLDLRERLQEKFFYETK